jgi:Spy/CpxP family protein refolding chaperone
MEGALGRLGGRGRFWNNPTIVDQLKLTDEQRKSMDDIYLQHREQLVDLRANLEKAELALEPLVKASQPDEGRITAQIDQVAQARAELEKANARFLLAIRGKLTPEQWKQVQAFRAEHPGPMRRWRQGGPGGQQGAPPPPDAPQ